MTAAERDHEVKQHLKRLKELRAVPRSDWHREFEDVLLLDIDSWNNNSYLEREVTIGEDAPRADYIIVTSNGLPDSAKAVFRIFRRHNVIEYKRPGPADHLENGRVRQSAARHDERRPVPGRRVDAHHLFGEKKQRALFRIDA